MIGVGSTAVLFGERKVCEFSNEKLTIDSAPPYQPSVLLLCVVDADFIQSAISIILSVIVDATTFAKTLLLISKQLL